MYLCTYTRYLQNTVLIFLKLGKRKDYVAFVVNDSILEDHVDVMYIWNFVKEK